MANKKGFKIKGKHNNKKGYRKVVKSTADSADYSTGVLGAYMVLGAYITSHMLSRIAQ